VAAHGLELIDHRTTLTLVFDGIKTGDHTYFVHSYHMDVRHNSERLPCKITQATSTAVQLVATRMIALQFHPEKSQTTGPFA